MTDQVDNAYGPVPATEPLALRLSEGLGPNVENVMKIELTKEWCMNMAKSENGEPTHPEQWSAGYDAGFKDGHQAACEALQQDAERYRWLRDNPLWSVSYRVDDADQREASPRRLDMTAPGVDARALRCSPRAWG